jgi:outer membrane protein
VTTTARPPTAAPQVATLQRFFGLLRTAALGLGLVFLGLTGGQAKAQKVPKGLHLLQAVGLTMALAPNILLQKEQVNHQTGVLQQNRGKFDVNLKTSISKSVNKTPLTQLDQETYGGLIQQYVTDRLTTSVGLEKVFRNGIRIGPSWQINRQADNLDSYYLFNQVPDNYSTFTFTLKVPLLKGFGRDVADADEMAADANLTATQLELSHTVSKSVYTTGQAYWNFLGAEKKLGISLAAEARARKTMEDVEQLVAAKERPSADLVQAKAELAEKTSLRLSAEQGLVEAKKNLGLAIGLPSKDIFALPLPVDPFPEPIPAITSTIQKQQTQYLRLAEKDRADLKAAKEKEKSAQILLVAAQKNLKPELNANFSLGYNGLQETGNFRSYLDSLNHNAAGVNYSASLVFRYPLGNNVAKGLASQKTAARRQAHIQTANLDRHIRSNVMVALEAVKRHSQGLHQARKAVAQYQKGVANERLKYRLGMATIIDLITIGNRLDEARLTEVSQHQEYAKAVIRLRFETGTLLIRKQNQFRVDFKRFLQVPDPTGAS